MPWHLEPMTAFDTETTGPQPTEARLVTACVVVVNDGQAAAVEWLVNPGIDIPAEATAVHGITTEHAREHGADPALASVAILGALHGAWNRGMPVVAYNASYDLTVLDAELTRAGLDGIGKIGPVIDPLVLDRGLDRYRRGSRKLTAACDHYRVRLDGAHDATADALAAARVAWRIGQMHPEIAAMSLDDLQDLQARMHHAWAENFQQYLIRTGSTEVIDPSWPIRRTPVAA